jgi:hypothetical protein
VTAYEHHVFAADVTPFVSFLEWQVVMVRTAGAPWILLAVATAIGCGGPSHPNEAPCRPAPLPRCTRADSVSVADALGAWPGHTLAVRGRVQLDTIVCLLGGRDRCSAGLRLVDDEVGDSLMLRGSNIGCHGDSDLSLCCGIDMVGKHVIAIGRLEPAALGPHLVVTSVCAP